MTGRRPALRRVREFKGEVSTWAKRLRVEPRQVRVQSMTRKWGSCSRKRIVTFSTDLLYRPAVTRRFVIVHELLHLRVRNHSRLFRSYLATHIPDWRQLQPALSARGSK